MIKNISGNSADYSVKRGKYTVQLTHPDRLLFGKSGLTKEDLFDYYDRIAPIMLPYMHNRPVTMHRFVEGITHEGFYHKDIPDYFPSWIDRIKIKKEDGYTTYVICNKHATLLYLANQSCITPHLWLSRKDKLHYPDRMIFDLDPAPRVTIDEVRKTARHLKTLLDSYDLVSYIMTTGSKGFHIVLPLKRLYTNQVVFAAASTIAQQLANKHPDLVTTEFHKIKRGRRIFIDFYRNSFAQTGVAPYAVRAIEGAPVATPLSWEEFLAKPIKPQQFTIQNVFRRLSRVDDPWQTIDQQAQKINNNLLP